MDRKVIGVIIFGIIALFLGLAKPLTGLPDTGHWVLATVVFALGFWIFKPGGMPFAIGCAIVVGGTLYFGLGFNEAAAGFAGGPIWTLIPALYFGFILQKTGLGKRVAYMVLKIFTPSWGTMALSWLIIGVALSALTPSITVRVAILMPIAISVVEACKQEYRSKGSAYITLIAWAMCLFPGTGWLTGTLTGPIILGFMPDELKSMVTFDSWLQILAVPWLLITVLFILGVYFIMKPKGNIGITKEDFQKEYKALGPISRDEIISIVVLVGALVLFSTGDGKLHSIPTAAIALAAFAFLIGFKLITGPEISSGINWDVVLFFGVACSLQTVFKVSEVGAWIEGVIRDPLLGLAATSTLLMLLVWTFAFLLIRFIDVPWGYATAAATMAVLIPILQQFGIHPLICAMPYLIGINFLFLPYQQPFISIADGIMQGRGWLAGHVTQAGIIYIIVCVIALVVCMPYWSAVGGFSAVMPPTPPMP